jgi:hypothetical protein
VSTEITRVSRGLAGRVRNHNRLQRPRTGQSCSNQIQIARVPTRNIRNKAAFAPAKHSGAQGLQMRSQSILGRTTVEDTKIC